MSRSDTNKDPSARGMFFEEFEVGQTFETKSKRITLEDISQFAELTGDDNPLHSSDSFAGTASFEGTIAHGLLGEAIAIGLIADLGIVRGTALALLEANCKFLAPIYPGDEVRATVTISKKKATSNPGRGVLWRRSILRNQDDIVVQEADFVSLIRRGQPPPESTQ